MKIKIIPLAAKKIRLRRIPKEMLYETIKQPDQTVEGYGGRTVKQKILLTTKRSYYELYVK